MAVKRSRFQPFAYLLHDPSRASIATLDELSDSLKVIFGAKLNEGLEDANEANESQVDFQPEVSEMGHSKALNEVDRGRGTIRS